MHTVHAEVGYCNTAAPHIRRHELIAARRADLLFKRHADLLKAHRIRLFYDRHYQSAVQCNGKTNIGMSIDAYLTIFKSRVNERKISCSNCDRFCNEVVVG